MKIKLQVVTVSVNYSDFLEHTIKENKNLFDKWIIVTDTKDNKTKELCEINGILCVQTDVFYENGANFNKYAAINKGLKYIDDDAWVLFLDSDIILHYSTRRIIEELNLDPTCLYGIDRLNIQGEESWIKYKEGKGILKENWLLTTDNLEFGARLVHHYGHQGENGRFEGWRPLGFFQLAYRQDFKFYPQDSKSADHCDLVFAREWPRSRRILIPEIYAIHLESKHAGKAVNWNGRRSQPFNSDGKKEEKIIIEESLPIISTHTEETSIEIEEKKNPIFCIIEKIIEFIKRLFKKHKKHRHYYGTN